MSKLIAEYPVEIEAGGRASRLRVKFLRWLDCNTYFALINMKHFRKPIANWI